MKKIGRPRKSDRKENISVNLPKHIVDKINDKLAWQSSRSAWIESAIKEKLTQEFDWNGVPTRKLLNIIHNRLVIGLEGLEIDRLTLLLKQVGEIVEEQ